MKSRIRTWCSAVLALTLGLTLLSGPTSVQAAGNADYNLTGFSHGNTGGVPSANRIRPGIKGL